jgi:hypothetical protein
MPETSKIAAQVVIAAPGVDAHTVTSRNVRSAVPDPKVAERVVTAFRALGFRCGEIVGDSFSIEAAPGVFQETFGISPQLDPDGRVRERTPKGARGAARPLSDLPADKLPETLRPLVKAVVFSEPPAFGPGNTP